ncbi:hypothetical protein [Clostridium sp. C8-1-8]|uniref:hypothetical protein n=1 Tax=Clostridium sp. C8-1-8 TaxID=2698831 RepID=UPI001FABFA59|nr:hypothetical protein [Clostridium sp. C8-1-8]
MKEEISNYLDKFEQSTKQRFLILHEIVLSSTSQNIEEKLWAKLPSFYVKDNFVRIIPFKDHINVEAKAVIFHKDEQHLKVCYKFLISKSFLLNC